MHAQVLHGEMPPPQKQSDEPLAQSRRVSDGLWVSEDFEAVREVLLAADGGGDADGGDGGDGLEGRVKCVAGYAGWHPEQLEAELRRNVWFLAEEDVQKAEGAEMAQGAEGAQGAQGAQGAEAAQGEGSPHTSLATLALLPGRSGAPERLRDGMWAGVMAGLGGEFEELADFPGDHMAVWAVMREVSEQHERDLHKRLSLRPGPDDAVEPE